MKLNEYQQLAGRTLIDEMPELSSIEVGLLWNAVGLGGEAGECVELAKKQIFHKHGIDRDKWKKELGDVLWYISACATKLDLTLEEICEHNVEKLKARYPEGFDYDRTKYREGIAG